MTRRRKFTDDSVSALKPKEKRYAYPDPEMRGHYVRVMPSGLKSFVTVARDPNGKQVWTTIGAADLVGIENAREQARSAIKRVQQGLPAIEAKEAPPTFTDVADSFLRRHVEAKALRSDREIRRILDVYVRPKWKDRDFISIRRGDVTALLDDIEDNHGLRQADAVLAIVRGLTNWFAARNDNYVSPVVRGMKRTSAKDRARERILSDDEIRTVWAAADERGTFGGIVQFALLTAQRREKIITLRWQDISPDGIWSVPSEDREKGTGGDLQLPDLALAVVRRQPTIGDNPYVFAGRGGGYFNGLSKAKAQLDAKVGIPHWTLHDLRRTARSLMSRAGVPSEIAERVMGHEIGGVEGVYDRHRYTKEKADALARLATLLGSILDPSDNVVPMTRAAS